MEPTLDELLEDLTCGYATEIRRSHKPKRTNTMNLFTIAQTLNDDVITIRCAFYNDISQKKSRLYTFLAKKSDNFQVGDGAAVRVGVNSTDANIKIAYVVHVHVHDRAEVDLDLDYEYQWAFAKVDVSELERRRKHDRALFEALRQQKQHSVRDQALASLGIDAGEVQQLAMKIGKEGDTE